VTRAAPTALIPRFIRLRDAPSYLGMDKNRFNREVRPHVLLFELVRKASQHSYISPTGQAGITACKRFDLLLDKDIG
jgi:hypothetical protein